MESPAEGDDDKNEEATRTHDRGSKGQVPTPPTKKLHQNPFGWLQDVGHAQISHYTFLI